MRNRPSLPAVLLVALVIASVFAIGYAGATSTAVFSPYSTTWEGASEFRDIAAEDDRQVELVRHTEEYEDVEAEGTLAVVIAPDEPYDLEDLSRIRDFVDRGGTLLVMDAFGDGGNAVLEGVGATTRIDGDPLRDDAAFGASPAFPLVAVDGDHPVARDVDTIELNHGSALVVDGALPIANSTRAAYLDRDRTGEIAEEDPLGPHPVVATEEVGAGEVLTVSDPSVFINVMLDREDNAAFAHAVLAGHDRVLFDVSHDSTGVPPLIAGLAILRESILLQLVLAVGALVAVRATTTRVQEWIAGVDEAAPVAREVDEGAIRAYVAERHPEWDGDRIDRVAAAVAAERERPQPEDQRAYSRRAIPTDR